LKAQPYLVRLDLDHDSVLMRQIDGGKKREEKRKVEKEKKGGEE